MASYGVEDFVRDYDVSRETCERLELFADLLNRWNRRVNLVSKESLNDLWRRHMADSAQLREVIPPYEGALIDVGSGAGFPGMVLAIMGLSDIHLIEASAGTGKTFTLAALYVRLVLGPLPGRETVDFPRPLTPPEILVVTFTEAATAELRDRIRARLKQAREALLERASPDPVLAELLAGRFGVVHVYDPYFDPESERSRSHAPKNKRNPPCKPP